MPGRVRYHEPMIEITIPGRGDLHLHHLVLDMNGTLATDGIVNAGVADRVAILKRQLDVVVVTADTHGGAALLERDLAVRAIRLSPGKEAEQKRDYVLRLGAERCAAVGNGANDAAMLETAALGICVLGAEGSAVAALTSADLVARTILEALDLLLHPARIAASLRR